MSTINLQDFNNKQILYVIERNGGGYCARKKINGERIKVSGFATIFGGDFIAIFSSMSKMFLRIASHELDFTQGQCKITYKRLLFIEYVSVRYQCNIVYSKFVNSFQMESDMLRDPTCDKIDENSAYFFQWCSELLSDQKTVNNMIVQWSNWYTS